MPKRVLIVACWVAVQGCGSDDSLPEFADVPTCRELGIFQYDESVVHPADGCVIIPIQTDTWKPFVGNYRPDASDPSNSQPDNPVFLIQDQQTDERICLNLELYPNIGTWKGKPGEYSLNCSEAGLCAAIYPDTEAYVATSGDITISKFPTPGSADNDQGQFEITLSNITYKGTEDICFHVDSIEMSGKIDDLSATL